MDTELEHLARTIGDPDLEPIDTAELLEDSLRLSLGGVSADKVREMEGEIRNSGDTVETPKLKRIASNVPQTQADSSVSTNASFEKVLIAIYETREGLVEAFETCSINTKTASLLSGQINKLASCIRYMGGEIEEFEPLNHVSGLATPNFYKNAQKVIETTMQCYSLGDVENAQVLDNGNKITIAFTGISGDTAYKAVGSVSSDEWTGNEAIDYVYTPSSGQMSVKSFENGRWINRNASGKYKIRWELEETNITSSKDHTLNDNIEPDTASDTEPEVIEELEELEETAEAVDSQFVSYANESKSEQEEPEIIPNNPDSENEGDMGDPIH